MFLCVLGVTCHSIVAFWMKEDHHTYQTWKEHENINSVMLATALFPGGVLELPEMS